MKQSFVLVLAWCAIAGQIAAQAEASTAEPPAESTFQKIPVYAEWDGNGAIYKGEAVEEKDGKILIHWDGGNPVPSWVDASKVYPTLEALRRQGKKLREVYAESSTGYYYRGIVADVREGKSLIHWDGGGRPEWVENDKVKPRKGHGLKKDLIADRELTAAEKAKAKKESAASDKQRSQQYTPKCATYHSQLDCMRTFDPCTWNGGRCQYRGY